MSNKLNKFFVVLLTFFPKNILIDRLDYSVGLHLLWPRHLMQNQPTVDCEGFEPVVYLVSIERQAYRTYYYKPTY